MRTYHRCWDSTARSACALHTRRVQHNQHVMRCWTLSRRTSTARSQQAGQWRTQRLQECDSSVQHVSHVVRIVHASSWGHEQCRDLSANSGKPEYPVFCPYGIEQKLARKGLAQDWRRTGAAASVAYRRRERLARAGQRGMRASRSQLPEWHRRARQARPLSARIRTSSCGDNMNALTEIPQGA
jgi:hypothetical protein